MKRRKREHSKRKTLLKAGLGRNSFETATGQPRTKKEFPFTGNSFYIRCKMTDYLKI